MQALNYSVVSVHNYGEFTVSLGAFRPLCSLGNVVCILLQLVFATGEGNGPKWMGYHHSADDGLTSERTCPLGSHSHVC